MYISVVQCIYSKKVVLIHKMNIKKFITYMLKKDIAVPYSSEKKIVLYPKEWKRRKFESEKNFHFLNFSENEDKRNQFS